MTKSAPCTARKLECTSVSSRSNTRHFFPWSSGWSMGSSLMTSFCSCGASSTSVTSIDFLSNDLLFRADAAGESSGNRQQHIKRILSSRVSHASIGGSSSFSSVSLPLSSTCRLGSGPAGWSSLATWMASGDRGVQALPCASVCVIKSGIGASTTFAAGVFSTPGDLKSVDPRNPAGVAEAVGVDAAVVGVSTSSLFSLWDNCEVSTCSCCLLFLRILLDVFFPPFPLSMLSREESGLTRDLRLAESLVLPCLSLLLWLFRLGLSGRVGVGAFNNKEWYKSNKKSVEWEPRTEWTSTAEHSFIDDEGAKRHCARCDNFSSHRPATKT